jgi:hypothetical protein
MHRCVYETREKSGRPEGIHQEYWEQARREPAGSRDHVDGCAPASLMVSLVVPYARSRPSKPTTELARHRPREIAIPHAAASTKNNSFAFNPLRLGR